MTLLVVKQATLGFAMALDPVQIRGDKGMIIPAGTADPAIQVAQAILGTAGLSAGYIKIQVLI
jgi:hypothetical protein